jgi:hypothetical protein
VVLVPTLARLGLVVLTGLFAWLALPVTASAATRPPTFRPQLAGPGAVRPLLAPHAAQAKTASADYSCSFAAYGSGISPVTASMTSEIESPWPVNQPDAVVVANDAAITLPTAVSATLTHITSLTVKAQATAKNATSSTISLEGLGVATSAGTLTEIPAQFPAVGQVTFPAKGTSGSVALPVQTVTYTPMDGTTAEPDITCTTTTQASDVSVTVGDATGSFYHCTVTVAGASAGTTAFPVAMTFSSSGTKKTGHSVTITLSSPDIASVISTAPGSGLTQAVVSADLAVTGAQSGKLHMSKTVTDLTATSFSMSGSLKLTKAGTVKIDIPSDFGVALSASGTTLLDLSCSLVTKPAPVALTLTVTKGSASPSPTVCTTPSPTTTVTPTVTVTPTTTVTVTPTPTTSNGQTTVTPTATVTPTTTVTPTVTVTPTTTASPTPCASSGGSSGSGGSEEGSGTPAGGVSTGGGVAPGANVALGIGGAALLLAGGGLVLRAMRRGTFAAGTFASWWRRVTRGR